MPGVSPVNTQPDQKLVHRFFSGTGATYDYVANLCTFGFDLWWKKKILKEIPENSRRIMDQACGTGILTLKIARRFPHCRVTGVELRNEYLEIAREKARKLKLKNVDFILGRAEDVFLNDLFDCITSSYLAKYADLPLLVSNAHKMLRTGGILVMHDFTYPSHKPFARIWLFYFKLLQRIGGSIVPVWKTAFSELPGLLRESPWVPHLVLALKENAFTEVRLRSFTLGTCAMVTARKG